MKYLKLFEEFHSVNEAKDVKLPVSESLEVNEATTKQFETDFNNMIKDIKSGYGWIDPEYVANTWENSSDSIDFELVKGEIYKRLIAAGLLAYPDDNDEEKAGKKVKSLKELGIKESQIEESHFKVGDKVKMSHGGTGVIVSLDKEDGADDEAYYNVELPNGDMMKHAPNDLEKVNEATESTLILNWGKGFDGKMVEFETDEKELAKLKSLVPLLTELGEQVGVLQAEMDNEKMFMKELMKSPRGDEDKFNLNKKHKEEISRMTKEINALKKNLYSKTSSFSKGVDRIAQYYFEAAENKKYAETVTDKYKERMGSRVSLSDWVIKAKKRALDSEEFFTKAIETVLQTAKPI